MSDEEFEKWAAIEQEMDVSPAVFRGTTFANHATEGAWRGWQARQPEIDALKAEVERLRKDEELVPRVCRFNVERTETGVKVCWGDHQRSDDCEWEYYAAPAPEVEPVYQVMTGGRETWLDCNQSTYEINRPSNRRILYTHPANDGLRKAIEEAIETLEWYHEERIANALQAALDDL